jgi:hypothetical protein
MVETIYVGGLLEKITKSGVDLSPQNRGADRTAAIYVASMAARVSRRTT